MQTRQSNDQFWWKPDAVDPHALIYSHIKSIRQDQSYRTDKNLRFIRLYGNCAIQDLSVFGYARTESVEGKKNRLTLNIVQSMCDTVSAKIAKNNPKPMFVTSGGDWSIQRKAKKLNKFCEGQFHQTKIYEKGRRVFLDTTIFGTGVMKIYRKGAEIVAERVFPEEIVIDDIESIHADPRQMHQVKWINREILKAQWPDAAGYIDGISSQDGRYSSYRVDTDMIQVQESWHLRSGKDAKDGKHIISIENKTLMEEDYEKDYFPFVFLRWTQGPLGFFGQGLAEQLQGIQLEINKILKTIQEAMHLGVIPKIFVQEGAGAVTAHFNNKIGTVIKYRGNKPPEGGQLLKIPQELFQQLDWLYNRAYEISGVSQLSAQAKKPAGLDSGKALREFNDIESERFILVGQAWEAFYLEAARQMIDLAREISADKEHKDYEVKIKGKRFFESIKWSDIDLEEDQYMMQVFPTSGLAQTPAGRFQQIQEYMQAGFITPERAKKLMDMPDLEADTDLDVAALDDLEATMEKIIDGGEYEPPEPYQNLQLGVKMFKNAYLKAKNDGAPDEVQEALRNWVVDAETQLMKMAQPAAPPMPTDPNAAAAGGDPMAAAAGGAQPIGVPEQPPVSPLLPVA